MFLPLCCYLVVVERLEVYAGGLGVALTTQRWATLILWVVVWPLLVKAARRSGVQKRGSWGLKARSALECDVFTPCWHKRVTSLEQIAQNSRHDSSFSWTHSLFYYHDQANCKEQVREHVSVVWRLIDLQLYKQNKLITVFCLLVLLFFCLRCSKFNNAKRKFWNCV